MLKNLSKRQFLNKLEYIKQITSDFSDLARSFATIIGSIVAGTTAGITGYFEIKKVFKKERLIVKLSKTESSSETIKSGVTTTTNTIVSTPASSNLVQAPYSMDINSGAFIVSILVLGFFIFKKFKTKKVT